MTNVTTFERLLSILHRFLFTAAFGHGRMIEMYLAMVCGLYGTILLLVPDAILQSVATQGDFFAQHSQLMSVPFLIKFYLAGYGTIGNILGWRHTQIHRVVGAGWGIWLFGWYSIKYILIGAVATIGFPFVSIAVLMCIRIMVMASVGLPVPHAPGRM